MATEDIRQVTDARVLAALAHPLRLRLLILLKLDGPATVSGLAQRTGQAPGNVSHHLRTLAAADLIEEVPELARDRREHWWRRTAPALSWSPADFAADPAAEAAARAVESVDLASQAAVLRDWDRQSEQERARWPDGPFSLSTWLRVTDAELAELGGELSAVIRRWSDRELPDDGQERAPALVFAHGIPAQP
jgi:DNA-binding transcriptional ArsR family regulator